MDSFLLVGQSNMAGRGFTNEVPEFENNHLFVLRNGRWQQMYRPVVCDRYFSGVCLAESFADSYSREHNVDVGLIPCADGGTSLNEWERGGLLYDHAVMQARLAQRTSIIRGILWHQGEAECSLENAALYEEKFLKILNGFREDLNPPDVPVLIGGLGDFLPLCAENFITWAPVVNCALEHICQTQHQTAFVSAKGLGANPDNLHFNAKALIEFGKRYYAAYQTLAPQAKTAESKHLEDGKIKSKMELL